VIRDGCQMRKWLPFLTSLLLRQSVWGLLPTRVVGLDKPLLTGCAHNC
jgi:hypothetical protein